MIYATGMYLWQSEVSSEIKIFNFGYLSSGQYIYVTKDVPIHGYFSKPKEVHKQKKFGKYWSDGQQKRQLINTHNLSQCQPFYT